MNTIDELPEKDGFYVSAFTLGEVTALINKGMDNSLEDEISAVRVAVLRTMLQLKDELDPADFVRLTNQVYSGARTVALLLKSQRALTGKPAESITEAIAKIMEELFDEEGRLV